jgi:hypothetical protein
MLRSHTCSPALRRAVQVDSSGADISGQPRQTDLLALLRGLCRWPWLISVTALLAPRAILVASARLLAYVRPLVRTRSTIRQGVSPPCGDVPLLGSRALALLCPITASLPAGSRRPDEAPSTTCRIRRMGDGLVVRSIRSSSRKTVTATLADPSASSSVRAIRRRQSGTLWLETDRGPSVMHARLV